MSIADPVRTTPVPGRPVQPAAPAPGAAARVRTPSAAPVTTRTAAVPGANIAATASAVIDRALRQAALANAAPARPTPGSTAIRTPAAPSGAPAAPRPLIRVFDSSRPVADGRASLVGDEQAVRRSGPANAVWAAHNVATGLDYYARTFGRWGVDGAGRGVDIVVNDQSKDASGAPMFEGNGGFYVTEDANGVLTEAMRFGSGTSYTDAAGRRVRQYEMQVSDDMTIHELTHGVIKHETGQVGGTADEAGAVNEALADVMAAAATRDWRIGEALYEGSSDVRLMRNIANPADPSAYHGLWTTKSEYDRAAAGGEAEEHYASGIVSHAAYRMQQRIGGEAGWRAVEQLFYATIDGGRLRSMAFGEVAGALRAEAAELWGAGSAHARIVDDELRRAGL